MIIRILLISFVTAFLSSKENLIPAKIGEKEILESICSSSGNIIAAIEMNEGWFKENSIEPGVEVFLP